MSLTVQQYHKSHLQQEISLKVTYTYSDSCSYDVTMMLTATLMHDSLCSIFTAAEEDLAISGMQA